MPENVNTSALSIGDSESIQADDNRQTMIKVDHVSMIFNMASEQLNSLKEYAIKIARRELFFEGFTALDDISFEVKKGDVFGIIGTNGSGKSTLLKIIAGVLEPTEGSCEINGNIAPLIELGAGFDTELSARENIYLNGALLGYSKKFIDDHFDEIVEFAEIEKFLDMPLKNYSSGMVARIAFAIATVIVPEILVVDEVLSVGDFMFQKKCEDRINELIEKYGVTVLIVSHSNAQIERMCNKAIWIEKGHVRMSGDATMLCHMYGGLGGRTGTKEAEQRVFDALRETLKSSSPAPQFHRVYGENSDSTNVKLALKGYRDHHADTVIITSGTSHINAVMGNSLGGALEAPVVSTKPDALSEAVERLLFDYKPNKIFTIDCGKCATRALEALDDLPWDPAIHHFANEGDVWSMSNEIFQYGFDKGYWSNQAAFVRFDNNPESLVASPYLYRKACPIFVAFNDQNIDPARFAGFLQKSNVNEVLCFGNVPADAKCLDSVLMSNNINVRRFAAETPFETCLAIASWIIESPEDEFEPYNLCIASLSLAQWPELLACGCYSAHHPSALLLQDSTSLDSIAACLDFIEEHKERISSVLAIGNHLGPNDGEMRILCNQLT